MSLTVATLVTGLIMLVLGGLLLVNNSAVNSMFKKFPRSEKAAYVFFGGGALWFLLGRIWNLSEADFGDYRTPLFIGFALVALLSFKYVPDFLAVRGLSVLILLGGMPLLMAGYLNFDHPFVWVYKVFVFIAVALAIYLGASPFRLRDFFEWLYRVPGRSRMVGAGVAACGLLVAATAFTY